MKQHKQIYHLPWDDEPPKHVGHKFGCLDCGIDKALRFAHEREEAAKSVAFDMLCEAQNAREERDMWKRMFAELVAQS